MKANLKKVWIHWALAFAALLLTEQAFAFKITTHVWLADQIANEINSANGRVQINGQYYSLDRRVADAIRKDPGAFVMGTLGADIYPDMFAGQMTTHPGVNPAGKAPGWQTDDWLRHVIDAAFASRNDSNIAFAAGYALHAAMDTWAHSYVNLYSGDVFMILENSETAQRHVALETYLTRYHANLRDIYPHKGKNDRYRQMRVPASFVRETLILNPKVAREYARDPTTATAYYDAIYRYYLAAKRSRAETMTVAGLLQNELNRIDPLLEQLPALKQQLDAKQQAFDQNILRLAAAAQSILNGIGELVDSTGIEAALAQHNIHINLDRPARDAAKALDNALQAYTNVTNQIGYAVEGFYQPEQVRAALQQTISLAASDAVVEKWPQDIEAAMDAWVRAWEETARELMRPHDVAGRAPSRPMQAWAKCWGPVMFPMSLPPHLQNLPVNCDQTLSTIDRVNTTFNQSTTQLLNMLPGVHPLRIAIEDLRAELQNAIGIHATRALDAIGEAVPQDAIAGTHDALPADPTGLATWLVRMWDSQTSAADLDDAFTTSRSREHYVTRRVTPALHRELGVCDEPELKASTYTQAPFNQFAPVRNAVTLSKLALLPAAGLNALISRQSPRQTRDNTRRQSKGPYTSRRPMGAVLIGAIRSIDGDHQWQPSAPPLPRRAGNLATSPEDCRRYGYPLGDHYPGGRCQADNMSARDLSAKPGFVLYRADLREPVFNSLFQPIATQLCEFAQYPHPGTQCATGESFPAYAGPGLRTRAAATTINRSSKAAAKRTSIPRSTQPSRAQRSEKTGNNTRRTASPDRRAVEPVRTDSCAW